MNNILSQIGIHHPIQDFFMPWIQVLNERRVLFSFIGADSTQTSEIFECVYHSIPINAGLSLIHPFGDHSVRHHFLFHSALEAVCFFNLHTSWINAPRNLAVSILGLLPQCSQIAQLKAAYPNAKLHMIFGNDIPGRVMDCKILLWTNHLNGSFFHQAEQVHFNNGRQIIAVQEHQFSMANFQALSGLRSTSRTHKPRNGFISFYEQLRYADN
jgi:hypothetical protein